MDTFPIQLRYIFDRYLITSEPSTQNRGERRVLLDNHVNKRGEKKERKSKTHSIEVGSSTLLAQWDE